MTKRGLWLFGMWVGVFLCLTYALFAPVWFVSFPMGVMGALMFTGLMFVPVGKGEPSPRADRHTPEQWQAYNEEWKRNGGS